MQSKNTYIIGDVHGEYETLIKLINKIPKNSKIIFVGDLVDRGLKSKDVIKFIRDNKYKCVLGNHEEFMISFAKSLKKDYANIARSNSFYTWITKGGKQTLLSYGLIKIDNDDGRLYYIDDEKKLQEFYDDVEWLKTLPLYIKIEDIKKHNKEIVISHASIANIWETIKNKNKQDILNENILWSRKEPKEDVEIFNIFGHTVVKEVNTEKHFIDVDTGCHYLEKGFGKLSAYCLQTDEVISVKKDRS
ncbi:metallophosphoesterase [Poseidonibacter sp.]|uniref:metallophosphoesterase n=1 Tax=Poseidonibacter sp. TaxID=2321188 RepID=UPI003C7321F1